MEKRTNPRSASRSRPVSPFCSSLMSKKILVSGDPPLTSADVLDASNHCWCAETEQILGPDRDVVDPECCLKGRSCFRSPFESML